jgi:hypothetical protein
VYKPVDDDSVPGHAKLVVLEDRELKPGDIAMVVPPNDIHDFTGLLDDSHMLFIVAGQYKTKSLLLSARLGVILGTW